MTDTQYTPGPAVTRADAARILIAYGFSAFKAHEIALDYERGDKYAAAFVELAIAKATGGQS